ncbi:hypothetical protein [Aeromicrobium sp. CTD01-1L150]|uniref:hypothetical protein n=1 Tax=Aeromicrobium sp. CTD01-1L150 TaxID=3341830 RepID=UPI0035C26717
MNKGKTGAGELIANGIGLLTGGASVVWILWCTWIAFVGGRMPIIGYETDGGIVFGLGFLFIGSPILLTLAYWVSMIIAFPVIAVLAWFDTRDGDGGEEPEIPPYPVFHGFTSEQLYGEPHQMERAKYEPALRAHGGQCMETICVSESRHISPGAPWHLAHDHTRGPRDYLGPAHPECNEFESALRGITWEGTHFLTPVEVREICSRLGQDPPPPPAGIYEATTVRAWLHPRRQGDNFYLATDFVVDSGPYAGWSIAEFLEPVGAIGENGERVGSIANHDAPDYFCVQEELDALLTERGVRSIGNHPFGVAYEISSVEAAVLGVSASITVTPDHPDESRPFGYPVRLSAVSYRRW